MTASNRPATCSSLGWIDGTTAALVPIPYEPVEVPSRDEPPAMRWLCLLYRSMVSAWPLILASMSSSLDFFWALVNWPFLTTAWASVARRRIAVLASRMADIG